MRTGPACFGHSLSRPVGAKAEGQNPRQGEVGSDFQTKGEESEPEDKARPPDSRAAERGPSTRSRAWMWGRGTPSPGCTQKLSRGRCLCQGPVHIWRMSGETQLPKCESHATIPEMCLAHGVRGMQVDGTDWGALQFCCLHF